MTPAQAGVLILSMNKAQKIFLPIFFAVCLIILYIIFPYVGRYSEKNDCDDITLSMYNHFTRLGFNVKILVGNLEITNETFDQTVHVWLLVHTTFGWVPYDQGDFGFAEPVFNSPQHREGYEIDYNTLLAAVAIDKA
nr:hypothetical protein DMOBY_05770 [Dehalococcoides mccartyi]